LDFETKCKRKKGKGQQFYLKGSASADAQHYRKFLFAIDVGMPNSKLKPVGLFTMEPAYRISDRIAVVFEWKKSDLSQWPGQTIHRLVQ